MTSKITSLLPSLKLFLALVLFLTFWGAGEAQAQVSLTGTSYTQDFDDYEGTTITIPSGWTVGTGAMRGTGTGTSNSGGYYAFGSGGDFSFGVLRSSTDVFTLGVDFTNSTGSTITELTLLWDYEQWRYANTSGFDVSGTGALSGNSTLNAKDFAGGSSGSNGTVTTTAISSFTLTGLNIANGGSFGLSWLATDVSGADNGVSIDNFSLTATLLSGTNLYWLGSDTIRGGSGTWAAAGTAWSATDADGGPAIVPDETKTLVFGGSTAGTVTVSGTVEADKGITFNTTGYTLTGGTAIEMNGASAAINTITTTSGVTATIATDITGSTGMTKSGDGTLILTVNKTYTGGTTISGGTLQLGDGTTNGAVTGNVTNNATLAFNNGSDQTFSNDISGSGALTKTGAGVLTLTGTNTYAGKTTITGGFIAASGESKFGANPASFTADQVTLNGGGIQSNGNINFDSNRGLTLGAGGGTFNAVGADKITLTNAVTGSGAMTKNGAGGLDLDSNNTFTGGLVINDGRVKLGNAGALNSSNPNSVTFGAGATSSAVLEINGNNVTVSGLHTDGVSPGTPVVENANGTPATLTVNNATDNTFAGTLQNGTGAGALALAKKGAGNLTLSGANTFTGGTDITGGSITAAHNSALGSEDVTVFNGSLLANSGITVGNDIVVNAASTGIIIAQQDFDNGTPAWGYTLSPAEFTTNGDTWAVVSSLTNISVGSGNFFGVNDLEAPNGTTGFGSLQFDTVSVAGYTNVELRFDYDVHEFDTDDDVRYRLTVNGTPQSSVLLVDGFSNLSANGTVNAAVGSASTVSLLFEVKQDGQGDFAGFDNFKLIGDQARSATLGSTISSGTATYSGNVTLESGVQLTAAAGGTSLFSGVLQNGTNGAQAVEKIGAGKVTLSNANTYTGDTTISNGILEATNTTGSATGSGNVLVEDGGTLGGSGIIRPASGGTITIEDGGRLAIGDVEGTTVQGAKQLTVGAASGTITTTFVAGSFLEFDLFSGGGNQTANLASADRLIIDGTAVFNGSLTFKALNQGAFAFANGDKWKLLDWGTLVDRSALTVASTDLPSLTGGLIWDTSDLLVGGTLAVIVPEPSRVVLMGIGVLALALRRRRV